MIKFRCDRASIEVREVTFESPEYIFWEAPGNANSPAGNCPIPRTLRGGMIERKITHDHAWFDTWAEAKAHLVSQHVKRVADLEGRLEEAKASLERVKKMENPDG